MDTVTHLLLGHVMGVAAAGAGVPQPTVAYWALVVGNSLPDLDVPASLLIRGDTKLHRTVTHTIIGSAALSLPAALVLAMLLPGASLGQAYLWMLLGALAHIGLDALNLFGVRLFSLARKPAAAGVLHIVDPALLALWTLGSLGREIPFVPAASLVAAAVYIAWRMVRASQVRRALRAGGALRGDVIPWYCGWRYVGEWPDRIEFGQCQAGVLTAISTYHRPDSTLVHRLGRADGLQQFLATARYPYAIIGRGEVLLGCALRQMRADYRPLRLKLPCTEP